jgi:hypothetical protein
MHFWRINGRSFARSATAVISKPVQLALLLCGLRGIASSLLTSSRTMASSNATASNLDELSGTQVQKKTPPAQVSCVSSLETTREVTRSVGKRTFSQK